MDSVPGQTFMNYAYSWGAAVVILGTLFKLTHIPGANAMLFIGMGTEVFVFFISGFDRPFDAKNETHLADEFIDLEDMEAVKAAAQAAAAQAAAASDAKAPEAENTEAGEEVKTESPFKSIIPPKTPLQDEDKKTPSPSEPVKSIIPQMPPAKPVAPQNNPFVFKPQTSGEDGEKSE